MKTLEQVLIEHSGASSEVFNQVVYDWLKENSQTDKQLGLVNDYKPHLPKCCQNCVNNTEPFCNCARPAMEMTV
jgi:hypothetical protein